MEEYEKLLEKESAERLVNMPTYIITFFLNFKIIKQSEPMQVFHAVYNDTNNMTKINFQDEVIILH